MSDNEGLLFDHFSFWKDQVGETSLFLFLSLFFLNNYAHPNLLGPCWRFSTEMKMMSSFSRRKPASAALVEVTLSF